jgi:glycosyltransferase involved in cell wall biosynthesis
LNTSVDSRERFGSGGRILIVVENLPVPYDRRVWLEASALRDQGYTVSVISPTGHRYPAGYALVDGIHVHRYDMLIEGRSRGGIIAEYAWAFLSIGYWTLRIGAFGRGFDVIQFCNPPDIFWPIAGICRLFGRRVVFDQHDLVPEVYVAKFGGEGSFMQRLMLLMERLTYAIANIVISTNESYKKIAIERGHCAPERVFVVRNGPDPQRLKRVPPDPSWLNGRSHAIVFLGEIGEQDGVDLFVHAARHIVFDLDRSDIQFVVLGGGPQHEAIMRLAAAEGLTDYFTFTGRVDADDINAALSIARIGVDPAPKTPFPDKSTSTKIMEYMLFGLPIVAFDLHETRVSAGDAAIYVPSENIPEFAQALLTLIDNPDQAQSIGKRGEVRVRSALMWEHSVPFYLDAMRTALMEPGSVNSPQRSSLKRPTSVIPDRK